MIFYTLFNVLAHLVIHRVDTTNRVGATRVWGAMAPSPLLLARFAELAVTGLLGLLS